ncbi:Hypothetical protein CHV_a0489 [Cardinium endosymbiont cBtQ1 of Bemisia tabaci]|nr:Hypothetical protein CHV_a0489 [Cardinium endosymbiont cBtQ1 of Bemisia tabaci]
MKRKEIGGTGYITNIRFYCLTLGEKPRTCSASFQHIWQLKVQFYKKVICL